MEKTLVAEPLPWCCAAVLSCAHGENLQTSVGEETVKGTQDTSRYWERKSEEMEVNYRTRELTIPLNTSINQLCFPKFYSFKLFLECV